MRNETRLDRAIRKANQHWEMAGLARMDGDTPDERRHTRKAQRYDAYAKSAYAELHPEDT